MPKAATLLGGLTAAQFLRRHWQKRPLFVRQALPGLRSLLSRDELASLACDEDVAARLVLEKGGARPWEVRHGPFDAESFSALPRSHWTLLVTDVDKLLRPAADLLEHFAFLPSWRIDDVMISYAADRGSVGPHVDSYDVFLLQMKGRRRWEIGERSPAADEFIPGIDLRILSRFEASESWLLEPGDMLYLPPGVAHFGRAEGACMTCSIGFRAPTHRELLVAYAEDCADRIDADVRYADPDLAPQRHPGEIAETARRRMRRVVQSAMRDAGAIDDWLGRHLTQTGPWRAPSPPHRTLSPPSFRQRWRARKTLLRNDRCRFAFIRRGTACTLYVDGEAIALPGSLAFAAPLLSSERRFSYEALQNQLGRKGFGEFLCGLYNSGYLYFP